MQTSVVNFQEIKKIQDFRIDAECFKPIHLQTETLIAKKRYEIIGRLAESVINFGAYSLCNYITFLDEGVPFIVTEDIKNNIIDTDNLHYISKDVHKILHKSHCRFGQVLLTMAGAYLGQSAVYYLDFEASSNQAIAKITLKHNSIEPFYLSTFLNCVYGQSQIERFRTGTGQPNLNLGLIQTIKIPLLDEKFQNVIKNVVLKGIDFYKQSKNLYSQAEQTLLSELGLLNWKPKHRLSFIKNFSETKTSERIDAEYFQPKYDFLVKRIKANPTATLAESFHVIRGKNFNYIENESISVLKTKQLTGRYINFEVESFTSEKIAKSCRLPFVQNQDVLFASMGVGSLGKTNIFFDFESNHKFTIDSTLRIFRKKPESKIAPEALTVFLSSIVGQEFIYQNIVGTSGIISIYEDYINNLPIPILNKTIQENISKRVFDAHQSRSSSAKLLAIAKRGVELAIEKNEKDAQKWIDEELKKLNVRLD